MNHPVPKPGGFPKPGGVPNPGGVPKPGVPQPPAPKPAAEPVELTYDDSGRPITGFAEVDEALDQVADLSERELGEHPQALAAAHEALARVLDEASGRR